MTGRSAYKQATERSERIILGKKGAGRKSALNELIEGKLANRSKEKILTPWAYNSREKRPLLIYIYQAEKKGEEAKERETISRSPQPERKTEKQATR